MTFDLEQSLPILRRTPTVLDTLLRDLPEPWLFSNEGEDTWSPFDVVGHLIHGERADWVERARIIRTQGEARPFDPFDRFAQFNASQGKTLPMLLDEFAQLRARNLKTIECWDLQPHDLDLRGRHPDLGVVTLRQLLATWVVHDLSHIRQITRTMAKQYGEEVGPWEAYLPVVHE